MDHRCAYILGGLIDEYVHTARPVGSTTLVRRLRLNVSPATMRSLLQQLDDLGYVYQPHTSAGRIPTDQGYRYYVDHAESEDLSSTEQHSLRDEFRALREQYAQLAQAASKLLAQHARIVALSDDGTARSPQIAGLTRALEQPEAEQLAAVRELSAILELMSEGDSAVTDAVTDTPRTYIGTEIPFFPAEHTSIVIRRVATGRRDPLIVAVIGPKRMAYQRNAALLNAIAHLIRST